MRVFSWIAFLFLSCQVSFGQLENMELSRYTDSVRVDTESLEKNVPARLDSLTRPVGAAIGNLSYRYPCPNGTTTGFY
jgi:hypothetical protein